MGVVTVLERLRRQRGASEVLYSDDDSEFSRQVVDLSAYQHRVRIDFSGPGKPTDNAFVESFTGTFRDESLNAHWFESINDANEVVAAWQLEYNKTRPHTALDWAICAEFARRCALEPAATDTRARKSLRLTGTKTGMGSIPAKYGL